MFNEIKKIDPNKSTGQDMIHPKLVNHAAHIISCPLAHVINCSLSQGVFPDKLKVAKVIPVYKKGSVTNVGNYRPISVLPVFSKIVESVVKNQLINYLEKYDILIKVQFGFRKKHSTKLALADLVSDIMEKLDNGFITFGIFIDLRKAFDTINHEILLQKLHYYGIRGLPLHWFKSYLSDRQQTVTINNVFSSYRSIECGVPQGSILGPILFLLYINDIIHSTDTFDFRLFADDTNMFKFIKDTNVVNLDQINADFQKTCNWCSANKLTVNVEKTNFMLIKTPQRLVNTEGSLSIDGNPTASVSSTNYGTGRKTFHTLRKTNANGIFSEKKVNFSCT